MKKKIIGIVLVLALAFGVKAFAVPYNFGFADTTQLLNYIFNTAANFSGTVNVVGATTVSTINYAADTAANDTYVMTLSRAPAAYVTGNQFTFKAVTANTGACSINVNGLGALPLKRGVSTDPGDNFIKAGSIVTCVYDGTNCQMLQPAAQ